MTPPEKKDALGNVVLMLTTIDRKNGQKLVSVVQYEEVKGEYFLTAPRSSPAEWKRNIHANPWVVAQVKDRKIHALAEPVMDSDRIADFLEIQFARRSPLVKDFILAKRLPAKPTRAQLKAFAAALTIYILHPKEQ